ncbi:MAG: hypothetical protein R3F49_13810 [Planctomycetota bacterium]
MEPLPPEHDPRAGSNAHEDRETVTHSETIRARGRRDLHPIERAVRWLLAALDRNDVPSVVLRGDRELPFLPEEGDLDLAVAPRHRARFERMLARAMQRYGVRLVAQHTSGALTQYQLHAVDGQRRHRHLCIDVHTAETCFGVPFLTAHDLLQGRTRRRGHARPDAVVSAFVDFAGPFLSGGAVREDYMSRLATVVEQRPAQARALLGRVFGTQMANELADGLRAASRGRLFRAAKRARRALLWRAFAARPVRSLRHVLAFGYAARVRPLFAPRGKVIAIIGTDGAGKTTLIDALRRALAPAFRASEGGVVKLRPGLLPQLDRLVHGRATYGASECRVPHRARPSGAFGSTLRAAWYAADYALGWPLRILPRRRRNALILFDRYVDDWLVDPERFRMRPGLATVRWLARLAPRPDATLVCTASLRTVRARKRELEARETLRQLEAYEALARSRPDLHLVSTDAGVEHALDLALCAIFGAPPPDASKSEAAPDPVNGQHRQAA